MGKPNEDFESKSVRLRIFQDTQSEFANSVRVETVKGHFVGWIHKEDSDLATLLLQKLTETLSGLDVQLRQPLVFDVSARVEGYWSEDDFEDNGKLSWEPEIENITIRAADPVSVNVRGSGTQFETMPETHLKDGE
jgi:hypothetical protein